MAIRVLMIGFGNVGQGFAQLLVDKENVLRSKYGLEVRVVGIVTRHWGAVTNAHGLALKRVLASVRSGKGFERSGYPVQRKTGVDLIENLDFDVLTELTVTDLENGEPATRLIRLTLKKGCHVVTANKGPIALHLRELRSIAEENDALLKYEGTVMSGTPILNLIENNLAGVEIRKIEGIVNGSTNYILTRMEEGQEYAEAVQEARDLGYLEADASADLEGWDAVAKVMILAETAFGKTLKRAEVERQGITGLKKMEVESAKREGKVWRMVAELERGDKDGCLRAAKVGLRKMESTHPLARIRGAGNALVIYTDVLPVITITGPGAGSRETGYAVLNDLIRIFQERR